MHHDFIDTTTSRWICFCVWLVWARCN